MLCNGNSDCLLLESYETRKYMVCGQNAEFLLLQPVVHVVTFRLTSKAFVLFLCESVILSLWTQILIHAVSVFLLSMALRI
jgi:hypothetical protein